MRLCSQGGLFTRFLLVKPRNFILAILSAAPLWVADFSFAQMPGTQSDTGSLTPPSESTSPAPAPRTPEVEPTPARSTEPEPAKAASTPKAAVTPAAAKKATVSNLKASSPKTAAHNGSTAKKAPAYHAKKKATPSEKHVYRERKHTGISHAFRHVGGKLQKFFTGKQTIDE